MTCAWSRSWKFGISNHHTYTLFLKEKKQSRPEETVSPEETVDTISSEVILRSSTVSDELEVEEVSIPSFPLGSKRTHRRAQRRIHEQERRQLREELSLEGGWYFGPLRAPPLESARTPRHVVPDLRREDKYPSIIREDKCPSIILSETQSVLI
ncbi:hypothetical protein CYMTET_13274 [Cymbomonas tetramitiformis]|uniref:Uncharacterized protein n=1 Tax=Cymbomonas tetramitiformis TaxID=36881 RepID=A0AAE0GJ09_9CHLO|nr:hypothetical protein CYMTET_13274 [Cymbomonas tetramitiformis]